LKRSAEVSDNTNQSNYQSAATGSEVQGGARIGTGAGGAGGAANSQVINGFTASLAPSDEA